MMPSTQRHYAWLWVWLSLYLWALIAYCAWWFVSTGDVMALLLCFLLPWVWFDATRFLGDLMGLPITPRPHGVVILGRAGSKLVALAMWHGQRWRHIEGLTPVCFEPTHWQPPPVPPSVDAEAGQHRPITDQQRNQESHAR